jgi:hypothetical protein
MINSNSWDHVMPYGSLCRYSTTLLRTRKVLPGVVLLSNGPHHVSPRVILQLSQDLHISLHRTISTGLRKHDLVLWCKTFLNSVVLSLQLDFELGCVMHLVPPVSP